MNDSKLDDKIRQALSGEDAELYDELAVEPSLLELALDTMKSRNRWMTAIAMLVGTIFMGLGVFSLWKLAHAQSVNVLIYWSLGFAFCMAAVSMMKIWYWMEMQRISVTREIKRLELQVACIAQLLTKNEA